MNGARNAQLKPLPEAVVASMTLRGLPGVDGDVPLGWAPAALAAASLRLAVHPGTTIGFWKENGRFTSHVIGGVSVDPGKSDHHTHPPHWYVCEIAEYSCELCGRPGRRHHEPRGVFCDSCHSLRSGEIPNFAPRLPLLPEAADALRRLPSLAMLPTIPAGWAPLVDSAITALDDGTGRRVMFENRGTHLAIVNTPAPAAKLLRAQRDLVAQSRERCRHCGRNVETDSATPGQCDGCRWVQSRGWETLPVSDGAAEGA